MVGKRKPSSPWFHNERRRLRLEGPVRRAYPEFVRNRREGDSILAKTPSLSGLIYSGTLAVPDYPDRQVEILFPRGFTPERVEVRVDGPTESPHRYPDGTLCIWYPRDPAKRRWTERRGLVELIDLTAIHLFKEAWWRETDEWIGEEAPHSPVGAKTRSDVRS